MSLLKILSLTKILYALLRLPLSDRNRETQASGERLDGIPRLDARAREAVRTQMSKDEVEGTRVEVDSGPFRQPVVRSGGAVHRPETGPRLAPCLAAEWIVAPASP